MMSHRVRFLLLLMMMMMMMNGWLEMTAKGQEQQMPLSNGNFELAEDSSEPDVMINDDSDFPVNYTTSLNPTGIADWRVIQNGVQLLTNNVYLPAPSDPLSLCCLHLNMPGYDNTSQGAIQTILNFIPALDVLYNVTFDMARDPDADFNEAYISMQHSVYMNGQLVDQGIHVPIFNITDTPSYISWSTEMFTIVGLSVLTTLEFESLSINYGCLIDNVKIFQIS